MRPVFTAEEMRRVDRRAVAELGIAGATLMENAGSGAAAHVLAALPRAGARVVVVCGKGGNGGDGFVVARWLHRRRVRVEVFLVTRPGDLTGDAAAKFRVLPRGVPVRVVQDPAALARGLAAAGLVVDALLGTGARGAPEGLVARAIEAINASGKPVVALDIPSGLPADGGAPPGPAVRASLTTTFAGLKVGLVSGPAVDLAGRVVVVDIGVPAAEVARDIATYALEDADIEALVPPRPREAHKGTFGHLLIVAGALGKTGAAALAAHAALRSGVGLVTVATPASQQPIVAGLVMEAMTEALAETPQRSLALKARDALVALADARDAVALGPGLGLDPETGALARALAREQPRPMVIDADALTALAGHLETLAEARGPRCLTPHPGEMARLLGATSTDVQRDRIGAAREFARRHGVHLVLKGAASVIAAPDGHVYLNPTGNPGMASGGTGDVLTGMTGAFLARGLGPLASLQAAVFLHGRAGDLAAARVGEESLVARDVVAALGEAFVGLRGARR